MSDRVIHFECPVCRAPCRFSEAQKAVQHSEPTCSTWAQHRGKASEFLQLALAAKRAWLLGDPNKNAAERLTSPEEDEKKKVEVLEQVYEGLKRL